ncbi:DUF393 domain-containing protein [Streptomyces sp. NBC_00442]|uniref:thiol-disulfide oxidoreductase DCC family protein n=1 Tax=Streptomyces sp. NBC_00442 TaxID=2903651 RepID=UPI002E237473
MRTRRTRPVLVYDGDCAFRGTCVSFAERRLRPRCESVPWQFADLEALGVTQQRAEHEVVWVTPAATVYGGAQAVAKLLLSTGGGWGVLGALLTLPPVRWIAHGLYRLVAGNRDRMPGGTPACALPTERRPAAGPAPSPTGY